MAARVEPAKFISGNVSTPKTLKVFARLQNGSETEVTRFARFEAFDATIAEVDEFGAVTGRRSGDTHILAHYAGQIGYAYALVPQTLTKASAFTAETLTDPIDRLIAEKLKLLNIVPTPICDDGTFLRRVHLDIIGQLPTPNDIRAFGANPAGDKRMRVIDDLLRHPLHAAVWATKLCDITGADNRVWVRSP